MEFLSVMVAVFCTQLTANWIETWKIILPYLNEYGSYIFICLRMYQYIWSLRNWSIIRFFFQHLILLSAKVLMIIQILLEFCTILFIYLMLPHCLRCLFVTSTIGDVLGVFNLQFITEAVIVVKQTQITFRNVYNKL